MKKSLILALLLMGFTGTLAQVALTRELLVTFYGNELSIGIILAVTCPLLDLWDEI